MSEQDDNKESLINNPDTDTMSSLDEEDVNNTENVQDSEEVINDEDLNQEEFQIHNHRTRNKNLIKPLKSLQREKNNPNIKGQPEETTNNTDNPIGNKTKELGKQAGKVITEAGKNASKAIGKATVAAGRSIITFIAANPLIALIILAILFIILILLFFFAAPENYGNEDSSLYSANCESMSLTHTSLTRSEFIEKVQAYFSGGSSAGQVFSNNAGKIYDIAKKNGINPELVVARAVREGMSPGTYNNYWGMGCTNTGGGYDCIHYSSFDAGVLAFVQNAAQYDSLSSMLGRFAYIGKYWYNPGGSDVGGCYYFPYIKQFMSAERASQVERACNSGIKCSTAGGSGCVQTTQEDQDAYTKRGVLVTAQAREEIFGIPPDECKANTANCSLWNQGDGRWGSISLGGSSSTMKSAGCAVTAVAMGIACSGADIIVDDFDPGVFVNVLNKGGCLTNQGYIVWKCNAMKNVAPSIDLAANYDVGGYSIDQKKNIIKSFDANTHFFVMHFSNSAHSSHYVLYQEDKGNTYTAMDSSGGIISEQYFSQVDQIVVYEYEPSINDENISTSKKKVLSYKKVINTSTYSAYDTTIMKKPVNEILTKAKYNSLNNIIYNEVKKAGVGTRSAIVAAAVTPIEYFAKFYHYVFPYAYGGGHGNYFNNNGSNIERVTTTYYGVDPNWGRYYSYSTYNRVGFYGPDCSAFVPWVYHNAGINIQVGLAGNYQYLGTKKSMDGKYIAKVGDFLESNQHIQIVVGVDKENEVYYVAHAQGTDSGVVITTESFYQGSEKWIVDMSSYIAKNKNNNYLTDYKNGVISY